MAMPLCYNVVSQQIVTNLVPTQQICVLCVSDEATWRLLSLSDSNFVTQCPVGAIHP